MNYKIIIFISIIFLTSCLSNRQNVVKSGKTPKGDSRLYNFIVEFEEVHISDSSLLITGTVTDTSINHLLQGVNLYIPDEGFQTFKCGAITDLQGFFKLQSENISLSDTLYITNLGYKNLKFGLTELKKKNSKSPVEHY